MIVISDFDNTLYPHDSPDGFAQNLAAVQKFRQRGNKFCLATGRNASSLDRIWPEYRKYLDYALLDNGAVCVNHQGDLVFRELIPQNLAQQICQTINDNFTSQTAFVYYHNAREWQTLDADLTKLRCWTTSVELGQQILDQIRGLYGGEVQSFLARNAALTSVSWIQNPERYCAFVDIMSCNAGKDKAIRRLAAAQFPNEHIITVGDDTNDLAMLKAFDGYAMQNSVPEVLATIAPDHRVSSVAELLNKLS